MARGDDFFPTTRWTQIVRARGTQSDLAALCDRYRGPVERFFKALSHNDEQAEDLTQDFFANRIVGNGAVLQSAEPAKGTFRAYLKACLRRFYIDHKRRKAIPNGGGDCVDAAALELAEPLAELDRQWAARAISLALEEVEADCRRRGKLTQWSVFEARIVQQARLGGESVSFEELMRTHKVEDRQKLDSMLQTLKRKFERELERVVADTVAESSQVPRELADLLRILGL